jgi:hypothetical protein
MPFSFTFVPSINQRTKTSGSRKCYFSINQHGSTDLARIAIGQSGSTSAKACAHKSRLFGNGWLMSALSPKAAV